MKKFLLTSVYFLAALFCAAQSGSITVTSFQQRSDGSGLVDVFYNLSGPANSYYMNLRVRFDAGEKYYPISATSISGDVGPQNPGNNRHIVWNPAIDHPNRYSTQTKLMVIAFTIESMNPCPGTPTVSDYDGNFYNTILIDNQCWMKENLKTTRTATGEDITRYCYNNNFENCELYGGLYDWNTMMNGAGSSSSNPSGLQGICPTGWHVPSDAEWTQLTDYLIGTYADVNAENVGNKLKSCRRVNSPLGGDCSTSEHPRWDEYGNIYGTNDFDFSALPGGGYGSGSFGSLGSIGYWWSATEYSGTNAWHRRMDYTNGGVGRYGNDKTGGFSVRCLRDL